MHTVKTLVTIIKIQEKNMHLNFTSDCNSWIPGLTTSSVMACGPTTMFAINHVTTNTRKSLRTRYL